MLVKTKTIFAGERAGKFPFTYSKTDSIYDIKEVEVNYCCKEMEDAFNENFIGFGEFNMDRPLNSDKDVNIFHCSPYPEGACWDEMAIKFCPWCKEEIQVKNIKTEKLKEAGEEFASDGFG